MKKTVAFAVALATATLSVQVAQPAEAAVAWDKTTVEVINKLPKDWPVSASLGWLDQYTGSRFKIVKTCSPTARRCITIKNGRLTGANKNVTGLSSGSTITIDIWKTQHVKPFKGKFGYYTKRYLLVHEVAHQRYMDHVTSCNNVMNKYFRCNGHVPSLKLTTTQKKKLAGY
jgi:hypothetical protein